VPGGPEAGPLAVPGRPPSVRPQAGWHEHGIHGEFDYDRVDIPGTHVPLWMVVGIVVGVVVLLAGMAFLLLR
jgi:hypothetical protein